MKLSVIIPMYNEASIVTDTAGELCAYLDTLCTTHDWEYEVIFSNDGSSDESGALICAFQKMYVSKSGSVVLVEAERNYGKGHAIGLGMAAATGDFVLYTDCDLAYGVEVIGEAALQWEKWNDGGDALSKEEDVSMQDRAGGCDVLIGSRNLSTDGYAGYTFLRKVASKAYIQVLCVAAGFRLSDSQCGFKGFSRTMGQAVFAENGTWGWAFDIEILLRAMRKGAVIREMPVKVLRHRESKIHLVRDSLRMLRDIHRIKVRLRQEK